MDDTIAHLIDQARTNLQRGNGAEALALYRQAADRARQSGDADRLAHCLRHIGSISLDHNDHEAALSAGQEAVAIYRDCADDSLELANALRVTALAHSALGATDQAARCWFEARAIYLELAIASGVAEADRWLAITPQEPPPAQP
jgi:tetratricopeptide (TPR) repeat protein